MRPTIIPEQLIPEGYERLVIAAPGGDLLDPDIAPVEAVVGPSGVRDARQVSLRFQLEPGDLERLIAGGQVWVTVLGQLPPIAMRVGP